MSNFSEYLGIDLGYPNCGMLGSNINDQTEVSGLTDRENNLVVADQEQGSLEDQLRTALLEQQALDNDPEYGVSGLADQAQPVSWAQSQQQQQQPMFQQQPMLQQQQQHQQQQRQQQGEMQLGVPVTRSQAPERRAPKRRASRQTSTPTSRQRTPKAGQVAVKRIFEVEGQLETCTSFVNANGAAAIQTYEESTVKKVKNPKRPGLIKGVKRIKYQKRCKGSDCNQRESECKCADGFQN